MDVFASLNRKLPKSMTRRLRLSQSLSSWSLGLALGGCTTGAVLPQSPSSWPSSAPAPAQLLGASLAPGPQFEHDWGGTSFLGALPGGGSELQARFTAAPWQEEEGRGSSASHVASARKEEQKAAAVGGTLGRGPSDSLLEAAQRDLPVSAPSRLKPLLRRHDTDRPRDSLLHPLRPAAAQLAGFATGGGGGAREFHPCQLPRDGGSPLWVGEKLTYNFSCFGISGGEITLEVKPFQRLGGRKVYHLWGQVFSSALFSLFYRFKDQVESFVDWQGVYSHRFQINLNESKQLRESIELHDSRLQLTHYWNHVQPKNQPVKDTREQAAIPECPQDNFSALHYLRFLPLRVGQEIRFPVVSEGKFWEVIATVLRQEKVQTPWGEQEAFVIHPDFLRDGVLKKNEGGLLWLSNDERRFPLRLEAKIKVGVVVVELKALEPGQKPAAPAS